ncbi:MAG: ROK family protein [Acidimicrobiales bacterium]
MNAGPFVAGFDIGGTNIRGVGLVGGVVAEDILRSERPADPDAIVTCVVDMAERLAQCHGGAPLVGLGVGCAGVVDADGVVRVSPNIATLVEFPLRDRLIAALMSRGFEIDDAKVIVDNDATMATLAEVRTGAARGVGDVVYVSLGTGIGAGFVLDGAIRRGAHGAAGEVGHMTVVHDGLLCVCGRRGCWEQYASGTALNRLAVAAAREGRLPWALARTDGAPESVDSALVVDGVAAGDADSVAVLETLAHWVAVGLADLVNTLDPAMIVIGGGLADIGAPLLDAIRRAYGEVMVDLAHRAPVTMALSHHGDRSGTIGAALAVAP